jgi:hypothetical protein
VIANRGDDAGFLGSVTRIAVAYADVHLVHVQDDLVLDVVRIVTRNRSHGPGRFAHRERARCLPTSG